MNALKRFMPMTTVAGLVLSGLTWTLLSTDTNAATYKGKIYALDSNRQNLIYNFEWIEETKLVADKQEGYFKSWYRDLNGKDALIEEATTLNGEFVRYRLTQNQLKEQSLVERQGNKLVFWHGDLDAPIEKLSRSEEDWDPRFSIGPMVVQQVGNAWSALAKGESLKLRFGVPERRETIGFTLSKHEERPDSTVIRMKPTSFIIAALVNPLYFHFEKDGSKIKVLKGRALPKVQKDGKWKDLDAEVVYYTQD